MTLSDPAPTAAVREYLGHMERSFSASDDLPSVVSWRRACGVLTPRAKAQLVKAGPALMGTSQLPKLAKLGRVENYPSCLAMIQVFQLIGGLDGTFAGMQSVNEGNHPSGSTRPTQRIEVTERDGDRAKVRLAGQRKEVDVIRRDGSWLIDGFDFSDVKSLGG